MIDEKTIKANNSFLKGDSISDQELNFLIDFYCNFADSLRIMGERFHFAWREANDNLNRLEEYKQARKNEN